MKKARHHLKMIWYLFILTALLYSPSLSNKAEPAALHRKLTLMVYMCGSNLESGYGSATLDLREMMFAEYDTQQVSLLVMAGGTAAWFTDVDAGKTQILEIGPGSSEVVWSDDLINMGSMDALRQFLLFSQENYPADDYALILWDHGGGPLEGVCWDELFSMDSLSLSELTQALEDAHFPNKLRWIGFDACLMSSVEVAAAMAPYAEYMIASQETEPAFGWNYAFLNDIEKDAGGDETGRKIVDTYFSSSKKETASMTLACVDLSKIGSIHSAMDRFFAPISRDVSMDSFSRLSDLRFSVVGFGKAAGYDQNQGYDLVDLQELVRSYSKNTSGDRTLEAIRNAIVYSRSNIEGSSGLSVYHPYENKQRYLEQWRADYEALDFCGKYTEYIERFGTILTGKTLADWSGLTTFLLPGQDGRDQFAMQLTPEQQNTFVSAQLIVLAARDQRNGIYGTQATSPEGDSKSDTLYAPVYVEEARLDESGLVSASYTGRAIYAVNEQGTPVLGPLSFEMSEDGKTYYIHGLYQDRSGREDFAGNLHVIFDAIPGEGDELLVSGVRGYDSATKTYTSRIPVIESSYTDLQFYPLTREMPPDQALLPGFGSWPSHNTINTGENSIRLPMSWQFRFFPDQMSASQLYAAIQITDSQHSAHMGKPVPITNPNLIDVAITPRKITTEDYQIKISFLRDSSPMNPGLNLVVEATNLSRWTENIIMEHILLNGTREAAPLEYTPIYASQLSPYETKVEILHIEASALTNLQEINSLAAQMRIQQVNHQLTETTVSFDVDHLNLAGIAPAASASLAGTKDAGIEWQLCSLEQNRYGDLAGLLYVNNQRDAELDGFGSLAINGLLIDGTSSLIIHVAPHTEAYLPFTLDNSALLKAPLILEGRMHWYWMSTENTLAMYGLDEISDLQIIVESGYDIMQSARMELSSPFPLSGAGETAPAETVLLMTGAVEARAERVLRAENGVGLRVVFENHQDHATSIVIGHRILNRHRLESPPPFLIIPAGGRTVYTFSVYLDSLAETGELITDVGLSFCVDGSFSTRDAFLHLSPEAGYGYLNTEDFSAVPVVFDPPRLHVLSSEQRKEGMYAASLSGTFLNGDQDIFAEDKYDADQNHLELQLQLTNLTDAAQYYSSSTLIINGSRAVDQSWLLGKIDPGQSKTAEVVIDLAQLRGMKEIHEIHFDLSWYPVGDYSSKATETLYFSVEESDLSAYIPDSLPPLASGSDGAVDWEICSLSRDEDSVISLLLRAANNGELPLNSDRIYLTADHVNMSSFTLAALKPGMDQWLTVSFPNELRIESFKVEVYQYPYHSGAMYFPLESNLLEHRGIGAISEIGLFSDVNYYNTRPYVGRAVHLKIKNPLPLDEGQVITTPVHPLKEGKLQIYPSALLVGNSNLALSLDVVNDTDELFQLKAAEVLVNGIPCEIYDQAYGGFTVLPHTTQVAYFCFLTGNQSEAFPSGQLIRDIVLSLDAQGRTFKGVLTLAREAPLGAAGGVVIPGNELYENISRAEALLGTSPQLAAQTFECLKLAPPLDDEQVSRFESGTATILADRPTSVLFRDPSDPEAEPRYLPARMRLCQAQLAQHENGVISADLPALIWKNAQGDVLEYFALTPSDGKEGDYILAIPLTLYRNPEIPLNMPQETSLEESDYDYSEIAAYLIHIGENGQAELLGSVLAAYDREDEEATDQVLGEGDIALGAAERLGQYMQGEKILGTFYDHFPVLGFESMSFVPLSEWKGPIYISYEIAFSDGTSMVLTDSLPE